MKLAVAVSAKGNSFTIVLNMTKADYNAIRKVMKKMKTDCPGKRIGYPYIGAGLATVRFPVRCFFSIQSQLQGLDKYPLFFSHP